LQSAGLADSALRMMLTAGYNTFFHGRASGVQSIATSAC
jgi:hypothetical protein